MVAPKSIRVHPAHQAAYDAIEVAAKAKKKPEAAIWKSFQTALSRVRLDLQHGDVIKKSRIPRYFSDQGVENLYCLDLSESWRCMYTIIGKEVLFLDIVPHPEYDKWFGLRKK